MKGGVACMLMVAIEILEEVGVTLAGDVVFTTVVDEEIGGMGSLAMVDRGYRADAGDHDGADSQSHRAAALPRNPMGSDHR